MYINKDNYKPFTVFDLPIGTIFESENGVNVYQKLTYAESEELPNAVNLYTKKEVNLPFDYHVTGGGICGISYTFMKMIESGVDWRKLQLDTPLLVWNEGSEEKQVRYFARLGEWGVEVLVFPQGKDSNNAKFSESLEKFDYVELLREEDKERFKVDKDFCFLYYNPEEVREYRKERGLPPLD